VVDDDHAGATLVEVFDFGLMGKVPPCDFLAEEGGSAATVNDALAHDAGIGSVVGGDEWLASVAALVYDAATAGCEVVVARVARGVEGGGAVNEEGYAGTQMDRRGEEDVIVPEGTEFDGMARSAVIDSLLDAGCVLPLLFRSCEFAVGSGELRSELSAYGRIVRFDHIASVLAEAKCGGDEEYEGRCSDCAAQEGCGHAGWLLTMV
jgi:hypothetical protein